MKAWNRRKEGGTQMFEKQSSPDPSPTPHTQETATAPPWPGTETVFPKRERQYLAQLREGSRRGFPGKTTLMECLKCGTSPECIYTTGEGAGAELVMGIEKTKQI